MNWRNIGLAVLLILVALLYLRRSYFAPEVQDFPPAIATPAGDAGEGETGDASLVSPRVGARSENYGDGRGQAMLTIARSAVPQRVRTRAH